MPAFGSFALLFALALSVYNLCAGAIALRQLATGTHGRISPERLAETARRAGIGGFIAVSAAAFALVWAPSPTTSRSRTSCTTPIGPCLGRISLLRYGRGRKGRSCCGRGCWLLNGFVLRVRHKVDVQLTAYASTILSGIQVFFCCC